MRVLLLTHRLPYAANRGDRIRSLSILKHLAPNAQIDLLSLVHSSDEESHAGDLRDLAASVTVARVPPRMALAGGVAAACFARRPLTHALLHAPTLTAASRRIVAAHRPDVILAVCSSMARFALAPPLHEIPMVLDMVDVDSAKWRALVPTTAIPKRWVFSREARRLSAFEAVAARAAHGVLVVNERERDVMLSIAPSATVHVVPNGVDISEFRSPLAPAPEPRVCFCGVMDYQPNEQGALWFATSVWPSVRLRHPGATLTFIGSHPTPALRRVAASDPSIEVTGTVPDVRPFLWRSAVSVAPLFVARGLQNKVLEAVASGLPTVITPAVAEGLPAEVQPACLVASDAAAFSRHVSALLDMTPDARRAVARRARLDSLTWDSRLSSLGRILDDASHRRTESAASGTLEVTA
jgi:sugar transferase (PEP-CTERM/EpsH1 system associated)